MNLPRRLDDDDDDESRGLSLRPPRRGGDYGSVPSDDDDVETRGEPRGTDPSTEGAAIEAILHPPRLDALLGCDAHVISYDPHSFRMVFWLRGRNFSTIAGPLLGLLLWDVCWSLTLSKDSDGTIPAMMSSLDGLISPLLTPVSFLLTFRLGRAAVRFWDSRAAFGKLVEVCRDAASTAAVACKHHRRGPRGIELRDDVARWICAFPIATKNFLRPDLPCAKDGRTRREEIGPLLSERDAEDLLTPVNGGGSMEFIAPILVLDRLRELAYRLAFDDGGERDDRSHDPQRTQRGAALYRQLNSQIDALNGAWGAMERIAATPLPYVYVVHLRTFLLLYLFLWNLQGIGSGGLEAVPALLAASWALLGIEAAAVECERPFRLRANHLPLGKMCVVVARNVAQTMKTVGY